MSKILILCHNKDKPYICKLDDVLNRLQIPYEICHTSAGQRLPQDIENYRGLIVMGGEMGVYDHVNLEWLAHEIAFVDKFTKTGKPVFGICLGCQMLAHVFGGTVYVGEKGMSVGFRELEVVENDRVFGDELVGAKTMSWQGDTYSILDHCTQLAKGCFYKQQAVKFSDKVYGVQFHPETMECTISRWHGKASNDERFPEDAPTEAELLVQARYNLPQVHNWLEKFVERLFLRA